MKWGHSHSVWKVNNNLVGYRKLLKTGSPIFNQFCGYAFRFISPRHPAMGPEISREKPLWFSKYTTTTSFFKLWYMGSSLLIRDGTQALCIGSRSLSHWTPREVQTTFYLITNDVNIAWEANCNNNSNLSFSSLMFSKTLILVILSVLNFYHYHYHLLQ